MLSLKMQFNIKSDFCPKQNLFSLEKYVEVHMHMNDMMKFPNLKSGMLQYSSIKAAAPARQQQQHQQGSSKTSKAAPAPARQQQQHQQGSSSNTNKAAAAHKSEYIAKFQ
jgi:hypothetical protein